MEKIFQKADNYAFIDSQNLNLSIRELGWKLDFRRFRKYLADKYGVIKAQIQDFPPLLAVYERFEGKTGL